MSEIQWFTFTIVVISLISSTIWAFRHKEIWLLLLPWILLFLHYTIFYVTLWVVPETELYFQSGTRLFSTWSSILRAQEALTIFGFLVYLKNQRRRCA